MLDFNFFYKEISVSVLSSWLNVLPNQINNWKKRHKKNKNHLFFQNIVNNIPDINPDFLDLKKKVFINNYHPISLKIKKKIFCLLKKLMPWKKGPFYFYGIFIDSEWKSNLKWERLISYIPLLLKNKIILDVGCGNGYYMWRMLGEQARFVVGIDINCIALYQFYAVKKLIGNKKIFLLPINLEQLPKLESFDVVFSMGVIYHCLSPLNHIFLLKNQLVSGGSLILESLIIEGNENNCLIPMKTYAKMNNVFFIPSLKMLKIWLIRCGFIDIKIINKTFTTDQEQRRTNWMINESLNDFLNPNNNEYTIEGYPAPLRVILIAKKP
ncbi:MAG: tRNA 5-methoxyuridine(34)/uridine 5-oxyacetic acid(34) synthase CmoB [Arsenophonus sp.]|nr:MAG: tRNA 5-methoxyuridine(34)/uridine 5-oxyacetic acid(34) synthase CmoB [Arsenophonus sp.]